MSSKFSGFLVALKNEMPCFRAFPAFFHYSSSSRVTTYCVTRFAVLQDIGIILSGIEGNNHIISVFLSQNYPWDNNETPLPAIHTIHAYAYKRIRTFYLLQSDWQIVLGLRFRIFTYF